jgi:transposase
MEAIPQDEQFEIFAHIDAGKSDREIERITGRTTKTIKRYRRLGNRPSKAQGRPQKLSTIERERIALRVRDNPTVSRSDIAKSESISSTYLGGILREFGVSLKSPRMDAATQQQFVDAYLKTDEEVEAICARFGRTRQQLYGLLRARKLPLRQGARPSKPAAITAEDAQLLRMYSSEGLSYAQIAERVGMSTSYVRSRVVAHTPSRPKVVPFTAAEVRAMVDEYLAGATLNSLARKFECNWLRVKFALEGAGCELRPTGFACRYQLNHDFFANVLTEEAPAYFAGLAEADFHVDVASDRRLSWTIVASDVSLMETFMAHIGHGARLKLEVDTERPWRQQYTLPITSKGMHRDLSALGIVSKSLEKRTFPSHLGREQLGHYLRGFIDGDGSWGMQDTTLRVSFYAARKYLTELSAWLNIEFGLRVPKIVQHPGICRVTYNGKDADLIAAYVYRDATVYLDRKRRVALRMN